MKIFALILMSALFVSCSSKQKTPISGKPAVAPAQEVKKGSMNPTQKSATGSVVTCTSGSDTRSIEVVSAGGGCEVNYTKMGSTNAVANSANGTAHCESVQQKMKLNLENAGHSCK